MIPGTVMNAHANLELKGLEMEKTSHALAHAYLFQYPTKNLHMRSLGKKSQPLLKYFRVANVL